MSPWGRPIGGTVGASAARKASWSLCGARASLATVTRVNVGERGCVFVGLFCDCLICSLIQLEGFLSGMCCSCEAVYRVLYWENPTVSSQ